MAIPSAVGASATTENYAAAFAALMQESSVKYMVCGSRDAAVHAAMKSAIAAGGENYKYRIGFAEADGTAAELISAAAALNSERMILAGNTERTASPALWPPRWRAALRVRGPAMPQNGAALTGLGELSKIFDDGDVNALITGGVTPIESVAGEISVVRGITTAPPPPARPTPPGGN